jgi:hypothetical protein
MTQSRFMSGVETLASTAIGYSIAVATQVVVFPWFGIATPLSSNLAIGAIFTVVSIARGYCVRRLFNWIGLAELEKK